MCILFLLVIPIIFTIIILFIRNNRLNIIINMLFAIFHLILSIIIFFSTINSQFSTYGYFTIYFKTDSLNIIFLMVLSILNFAVSLYNIEYTKNIVNDRKKVTNYTILYILFITFMTGAVLSTHIGLFWVFIEATTLVSTLLIYTNKTKATLEATWKYLFLCTIGFTLAFVGIILLSIGNSGEIPLFFEDIYNNVEMVKQVKRNTYYFVKMIDPFWLRLSFVFIVIGFGTKVGLVPVHSWLPDTHSEAPPPISALLSGTLLNITLLGIIRYQRIMIKAKLETFSNTILLIMGFLSLLIAASFLLKIKNYKRMLAYSSIENMGIIVIAISIGGIGNYIAMIHIIMHSLMKCSLFLTSGNILYKYNTKQIDEVRGILKLYPLDGITFLISFFLLIGIPPSLVFLSEFLLTLQFIKNGSILLLVVFVILITIIIYALGNSIIKMVFGKSNRIITDYRGSIFSYIPQIFLILVAILLSFVIPLFLSDKLLNLF